jgi:hypothetical protein
MYSSQRTVSQSTLELRRESDHAVAHGWSVDDEIETSVHGERGATDTRSRGPRAQRGREAGCCGAADTAASFAHGRPASDRATYVRSVEADASNGNTCEAGPSQDGG